MQVCDITILLKGCCYKNSFLSYGSEGKNNAGNAGPNAVQTVNLASGGLSHYSYDNNGNRISGDGKTISYNAFNKPVTISTATSVMSFSYGADGMRYKQVKSSAAGVETTHYVDKLAEVVISAGVVSYRSYIDDIAIVTRDEVSGQALDGHRIRYTHRDRLGSVISLTDHNNLLMEHRSYDPFGKPRHGSMQDPLLARLSSIAGGTPFTTRGFTDHEHLDDAELIHMNGRVYDYNLGRFLSVDPFIQAPGNSQSMNPYSYIMNNPLAGTDPSGYIAVASVNCRENMGACAALMSGRNVTRTDMQVEAVTNGNQTSSDSDGDQLDPESIGAPGALGDNVNENGWNITAEQYKTLSSLAGEDRRTEYYLALYEMTGSTLAIQMAQISSNSGFLGGVAWEANQKIKDDFGEAYPGTIENFSTMVFKNDFAQITTNGHGGFYVSSDLKMTHSTVNLWKSIGLGDVAPPQVLIDNLTYGMAAGATISAFRIPQAMGYVGAAIYNETYGNQRGIYKGQFMNDHPNASVSYTEDGRFMIISGDKVYSNINVHPPKDIVVYPTFQ